MLRGRRTAARSRHSLHAQTLTPSSWCVRAQYPRRLHARVGTFWHTYNKRNRCSFLLHMPQRLSHHHMDAVGNQPVPVTRREPPELATPRAAAHAEAFSMYPHLHCIMRPRTCVHALVLLPDCMTSSVRHTPHGYPAKLPEHNTISRITSTGAPCTRTCWSATRPCEPALAEPGAIVCAATPDCS